MDLSGQGQLDQFKALWARHHQAVSAYIWTLLPHRRQSNEVLRHVGKLLLQHFSKHDPAMPFLPWAIGAARQATEHYWREHPADSVPLDTAIVDRVTRFYQSQQIDFARWSSALRKCVSQMHGRNRQALGLCYASNLTPAQIAAQMNLSTDAVRIMLHRVREALRRCVENELKDPEGVTL